MRANDDLYAEILLWMFRKKDWFNVQELQEYFGLSAVDLEWVQRVLLDGSFTDFKGVNSVPHYCITAEGAIAAIQYIELHEAREGGKRAMKIAIAAIAISILVGVAQIWITIYQSNSIQQVKIVPDTSEVSHSSPVIFECLNLVRGDE